MGVGSQPKGGQAGGAQAGGHRGRRSGQRAGWVNGLVGGLLGHLVVWVSVGWPKCMEKCLFKRENVFVFVFCLGGPGPLKGQEGG